MRRLREKDVFVKKDVVVKKDGGRGGDTAAAAWG